MVLTVLNLMSRNGFLLAETQPCKRWSHSDDESGDCG